MCSSSPASINRRPLSSTAERSSWIVLGDELLIDDRGQIAFDGDRLSLIPAAVSSITRQVDGRFQFVQAYIGSLDETWSTRIQPKFTDIGIFPVDQDPNGLAWASAPTAQQGFINRRGKFVVLQQQSKL